MIRVARQNATTYSGTTAGPGEKPSAFEAHLVGEGPNRLANVKDLETKGAERWTVVRPALLRPDVLHLDRLDDDTYRAQRADIVAALADPKRRDTLFADLCTCVRTRPQT